MAGKGRPFPNSNSKFDSIPLSHVLIDFFFFLVEQGISFIPVFQHLYYYILGTQEMFIA